MERQAWRPQRRPQRRNHVQQRIHQCALDVLRVRRGMGCHPTLNGKRGLIARATKESQATEDSTRCEYSDKEDVHPTRHEQLIPGSYTALSNLGTGEWTRRDSLLRYLHTCLDWDIAVKDAACTTTWRELLIWSFVLMGSYLCGLHPSHYGYNGAANGLWLHIWGFEELVIIGGLL